MCNLNRLKVTALFLILFSVVADATPNQCHIGPEFDRNLDYLLDWCEKHHKPEAECTELLELAAELPEKDFRSKLYELQHSGPKSKGFASTDKNLNEVNWKDIPHEPTAAYKRLVELSEIEGKGFSKKIEITDTVTKNFETLKPAEVTRLYEVLEKMKTSPTRREFDNFLKGKRSEYLKSEDNKACSGKDVIALRLSLRARMCFQFDPDDTSNIKILCVGPGRHCYEH